MRNSSDDMHETRFVSYLDSNATLEQNSEVTLSMAILRVIVDNYEVWKEEQVKEIII